MFCPILQISSQLILAIIAKPQLEKTLAAEILVYIFINFLFSSFFFGFRLQQKDCLSYCSFCIVYILDNTVVWTHLPVEDWCKLVTKLDLFLLTYRDEFCPTNFNADIFSFCSFSSVAPVHMLTHVPFTFSRVVCKNEAQLPDTN